MSYNELVKNFNRIRDYMREFYVYGFKSRDEYTKKSARSYDDERRRLESWLGDYMQFRRTPDGKNVFISIDSRQSRHNPLYKAWKTKSFTDGDITLHFILFDILSDEDKSLSINEIMEELDDYLGQFENPRYFDVSTVRKKLKEYTEAGIIITEKKRKTAYYKRNKMSEPVDCDILNFFSEVSPCGVVGSFLLDKIDSHEENFLFKHHYITSAMDSEVLCLLLMAMQEKCSIALDILTRKKEVFTENDVVPLKIMISAQNGRQYLMAYVSRFKRITSYRLDNIVSVKTCSVNNKRKITESENLDYDILQEKLKGMLPHIWGVSTQGSSGERMEHVEFTIRYAEYEQYIPRRMEREKRCGTLEYLEGNKIRFSADVYDAEELVPWIRTFICRITDISFSDKKLEEKFKNDIMKMYALYGLEGGGENGIQ